MWLGKNTQPLSSDRYYPKTRYRQDNGAQGACMTPEGAEDDLSRLSHCPRIPVLNEFRPEAEGHLTKQHQGGSNMWPFHRTKRARIDPHQHHPFEGSSDAGMAAAVSGSVVGSGTSPFDIGVTVALRRPKRRAVWGCGSSTRTQSTRPRTSEKG